MHITKLSLEHFRNYSSCEIDLAPGITIFLGRNGQGKTNLIEAINFPIELGSHRSPRDEVLIQAGFDNAIIRLEIALSDRHVGVDYQINRRGPNRVQFNRQATRTAEISRFYRAVLFAPEDLSIVRGEPSYRRNFIDELLVQLKPRFAEIFSDYDRALRQRNALLKSARKQYLQQAPETLHLWSEQVVTLGSKIIVGRLDALRQLLPRLHKNYQYLVENDHLPEAILQSGLVEDHKDFPDTETEVEHLFQEKLLEKEKAELERGVTLLGPHRDDIFFGLNSLPVRGYASHGESWSFALSLRLSEAELLQEESAYGDPIIMLDDVFAELDASRRTKLAQTLERYEQVIITAAVAEDIPDNLTGNIIHIHNGEVVK